MAWRHHVSGLRALLLSAPNPGFARPPEGVQENLGAARRFLVTTLLCAASAAGATDDFVYTVQAGDHPWNIAQRYFKNPTDGARLARLNRIPDDHRIQPGTRLRIPMEWLKLQSVRVRVIATYGDTVLQPSGNGVARALLQGETLQAGATLRTGTRASATLEFDDGSRVLVRQDSELRLLQSQQPLLANGRQVELELVRGSLENTVAPVSGPAGRFEIRSPAATAAVRGTHFRVTATERQTWAEVVEGAVLVRNAVGQVATDAGSGTFTQAGQAPGVPVRLLAAPDLAALPERLERLPLDWPVPAIAGAVRYRTQLAPDARFEVVVSDEVSTNPRVQVSDIADDTYVLRMRGIDAAGLEGVSATHLLTVHARPEPPLLIEPAPDAVTSSARPVFRWTQRNPRWHYRLQLAPANNSFAASTLDLTLIEAGSATPPADLADGRYLWRVAAINPATGRQGPWGDAQPLRRVLPGPDTDSTQPTPGHIALAWSAQPRARSYRLQVSADGSFNTLLVDTETRSTQTALERLAPGLYHVRVQATGEDGYIGPWGAPQTFSVAPAPEPGPDPWKTLRILLPLLLLGLVIL